MRRMVCMAAAGVIAAAFLSGCSAKFTAPMPADDQGLPTKAPLKHFGACPNVMTPKAMKYAADNTFKKDSNREDVWLDHTDKTSSGKAYTVRFYVRHDGEPVCGFTLEERVGDRKAAKRVFDTPEQPNINEICISPDPPEVGENSVTAGCTKKLRVV